MKTKILIPVLLAFAAGSILLSCQQDSEKKSGEELKDSVETISNADVIADEEYVKFKTEKDVAIRENEKSISEFKERMKKADEKFKAKYREKVVALEEKNEALKKKMAEYNDKRKEKWEEFKREFNHDMDELGNAIKDLLKDNTK